jgi:hypothetical protein
MKKISIIASGILLASVCNADVKVEDNINYVAQAKQNIKDNTSFQNDLIFQQFAGEDLQVSDKINGDLTINNFEGDITKHFEIKVGVNALINVKGDELNQSYHTPKEAKKIQGYGKIKVKLLDDTLKASIGMVKIKTPLINSKTNSTIFDTYFLGGLMSGKINVEDRTLFIYSGYIKSADYEMTGLEDLNENKGIYTIGAYYNDNVMNELNGQVVFSPDNYIQMYGDASSTFYENLKISGQVVFQKDESALKLNDNFIFGGKIDYLIDDSNYLSGSFNRKKDLSITTRPNTYITNLNTKIYTNSLFFNTLEVGDLNSIKLTYKTKIHDVKYSTSILKYFNEYDKNMMDESKFELDFSTEFSIEQYYKNTKVFIDFGYLNRTVNNSLQSDKLLRLTINHKF